MGGLRAWLCAKPKLRMALLIFDALRGVLDKRILSLLRVNGFPYLEFVQFLLALAEQIALCTTRALCPALQDFIF